jgi:hypothetical protein
MGIMSYIVGFGLAAGAGGRALLVVFGLGLFHYTEYFELSDPYLWLAAPPVLAVVGVLALVEILADLSPDVSELADLAGYLPAAIAGFIALSAATGQVDDSLRHLALSGVLGGATGVGVRWARNKVSEVFRDASDVTVEGVHKTRSIGETALTAGIVGTSFIWPFLAVGILAGAVLLGMWATKKVAARVSK